MALVLALAFTLVVVVVVAVLVLVLVLAVMALALALTLLLVVLVVTLYGDHAMTESDVKSTCSMSSRENSVDWLVVPTRRTHTWAKRAEGRVRVFVCVWGPSVGRW